ncbi:hypothetical protein AC249_AIPGENE18808, partial [Exaiptasia diaphana]
LRILKRPDSGNFNSGQSAQEKNEGPIRKSLAERQAEYAEASYGTEVWNETKKDWVESNEN